MRPHMPWSAPKWAFDKNKAQNIPIPPNQRPKNLKRGLIKQSGEMKGMYDWEQDDKTWEQEVREKSHAYWSSLTFSDYQVGRIIAQLDALKLRENTIIVIWGDHGWNLGEQGLWGKHNIIETSLRSQLIVLAPKMTQTGQASHAVTDSTDIFPSLCDLAGIKTPTGLNGKSFAKNIMKNPLENHRDYAVSHWQQGTSIRRGDWRCIRWKKGVTSLQNVKTDPYWAQDLAKENPAIIEAFKKDFAKFDQELENK